MKNKLAVIGGDLRIAKLAIICSKFAKTKPKR